MYKTLLFLVTTLIFATAAFGQKTTTPKAAGSGAFFSMTIEHNGQKTDVSGLQFQTADGNAMNEGDANSRLMFFFGASNNKDEKSFSFQGFIPTAAKGTYQLGDEGDGAGFNIRTTAFNNVPMFMAKSGSYEVTAVPLKGGFVEGTFNAVCENVKDDGSTETYTFTGKFKLPRR
ncbi:MAG TPA: hypothetical protein PKA82_10445 [Pyrinomonadaceae bacterium]|nr:hypothetical protein [Pyrinomonadaceae bacterium]